MADPIPLPVWTPVGRDSVAPVLEAIVRNPNTPYLQVFDESRGIIQVDFRPRLGSVPTGSPPEPRFGVPRMTAVAMGASVNLVASVITLDAWNAYFLPRPVPPSDPELGEELNACIAVVLQVETELELALDTQPASKLPRRERSKRATIHGWSRKLGAS